ncbi:MAG: chromosome partitioning protein ParA [Sphingobium sp.]|nr:MAG: chromosome partitioning protein ParA [Sphingobium sp.]
MQDSPKPDTDPLLSAIAARIAQASNGRAAAPRLRQGVLTVMLDVTGLPDAGRAVLEQKVRDAIGRPEGISDVRIAQTAQKQTMRIIAVGSGKGGVGKSTVSANLAVALKRAGHKVGLVDADIYGPSQPRLMGSEGERAQAEDKQLIPIMSRWGVPMLSMGHLVEPGRAIAWRGPMAGGALGQLIDARWDDVDTLIVDLPPGTGDVQLSMIQKHRPTGAVIVSTPQDLALIDAARAISLFEQANVPIVGLIENMAGYMCPHCGEMSDPFGSGGAEAEAARTGAPFLGRIPLTLTIRSASDAGEPPASRDGPEGKAFAALANRLAEWLSSQ